MEYVNQNGRLIAKENAAVSLADRGFRYGDSLFETIRLENGYPYQWDFHMARLAGGLAAIRIDFAIESLKSLSDELIYANALSDGLLRIQISRGEGGRGYLPDADSKPTLVMETMKLPVPPAEAITLWQSTYEKISDKSLPVQHKLSQGLNSTLARMEAADNGCFDALMMNARGEICETSSANIFWCKNDVWYTPDLSCGVLAGSTRAALLRLLGDKAKETTATLAEITHADAVVICNVAWGVVAVNRILPLDLSWESELHAKKLNDLYYSDIGRLS